ncbi:acyltransferase family protein [Pseudomonas sp. 8O]|uniref:acyltransferase family protein n=1 Tax=Pseudomonas sp. 8O TaxID=2653165 RepID=UPI0012F0219D|nr:acyltransferase [Pseudomonas sp. 8O]VXB47358.1 Peptidoglycan/LPS O-acetylase OafA/YrhL [Pseudomonas sp. 8O]
MDFSPKPIPSRFYSLDVVRGLAALSVVFWHWQHFLYGTAQDGGYRISEQPFYSFFSIIYHWGWLAVDFFFALSGFVFFWLYAGSISAGKVSGKLFFVARFSRLYPLHFLTLLLVLVGQYVYFQWQGRYFTYQYNDLYHFSLNLFMASEWGFQSGASFNAPIWSVSIEVLLYLAFFALCLIGKPRVSVLCVLLVLGVFMSKINPGLGRGITSFFAGGVAFYCYDWLRQSAPNVRLVLSLWLITAVSWVFLVFTFKSGQPSPAIVDFFSSVLPRQVFDLLVLVVTKFTFYVVTVFMFPMAIVSIALIETFRGGLGRRVSFLGHLSYSSYLIHFPLQLFFAVCSVWLGVGGEFFYTEYSIIIFMAALIPMCFASYYYFEVPMQSYIRQKLSPRKISSSLESPAQ